MIELLTKAVSNKKVVRFNYDNTERVVCPHLLGNSKKGLVLQAFQFGGASSDGVVEGPEQGGWRYFYLDRVNYLEVDNDSTEWYPVPDLTKAETEYKPPKFITEVIVAAPR